MLPDLLGVAVVAAVFWLASRPRRGHIPAAADIPADSTREPAAPARPEAQPSMHDSVPYAYDNGVYSSEEETR